LSDRRGRKSPALGTRTNNLPWFFLESPPTKTSFGPDGKNQLSFPINDLQRLFPSSLPTKTSFGPDGKKQLSMPTNDLQQLFLGSLSDFENQGRWH